MKFLTILFTFLVFLCEFACAHEIAVTLDDLPGAQDGSAENLREINERILEALKKYQAPAIGFVNEEKLYSKGQAKEKIAILQSWIDYGQPLGNHTYSHPFLSSSKLEEFEADVLKGAIVSKKLMNDAGLEYIYFRHPYLDTGTTKEMRSSFEAFLKKEGYVIAPVTVDTDDWKFNQQLFENPEDKEKIIQKYLEHTKKKFAFYEKASKEIFGRIIRHIWILHVNLINSYAMEDLLKIVHEIGYDFITLDKALEDEAYSEPDNYYPPFGISWLYRWDFTRGKVVDWSQDPEPDDNPFIKAKSLTLFDKARSRSIPIELYGRRESQAKAKAGLLKLPVVIINHGDTLKNTEYSFIANSLATQGYLIVSIQHQLLEDPSPVERKTVFETRKPEWEQGVKNILFTLSELKKIEPNLDLEKVTLIGHSTGGDISMLFASHHPDLVAKVISLDSLSYPFPTANRMPILFLRGNDRKADEGVLPESGATIITLKSAQPVDMCDRGSEKMKQEINEVILKFLRGQL
ncbi:MAG TPA: alpha/beta fold hydrolase [Alphaproteobacteria bacterium]|nr:alpha/beta fold hydrolase [Alphaproteobacteria bacterium]